MCSASEWTSSQIYPVHGQSNSSRPRNVNRLLAHYDNWNALEFTRSLPHRHCIVHIRSSWYEIIIEPVCLRRVLSSTYTIFTAVPAPFFFQPSSVYHSLNQCSAAHWITRIKQIGLESRHCFTRLKIKLIEIALFRPSLVPLDKCVFVRAFAFAAEINPHTIHSGYIK